MDITALIPVIFLSGLALWKHNPPLFLLASYAALFTGFYMPDIITGGQTTPVSLAFGVIGIIYALWCLINAYVVMFWNRE